MAITSKQAIEVIKTVIEYFESSCECTKEEICNNLPVKQAFDKAYHALTDGLRVHERPLFELQAMSIEDLKKERDRLVKEHHWITGIINLKEKNYSTGNDYREIGE